MHDLDFTGKTALIVGALAGLKMVSRKRFARTGPMSIFGERVSAPQTIALRTGLIWKV